AMTGQAGFRHRRELRTTRRRRTRVRVMAVAAAQVATQYRVRMGQRELTALVEVALETRFRRTPGINDREQTAAVVDVDTSGAVAGFATDRLAIATFHVQGCVRRAVEVHRDRLVAGGAIRRTD